MARNCTYEITINGEKKVFNSEMELDTFLDNYAQNMVVDNVDATLQVDQQQVTVDKISEAIKKYKSLATEFEITNEDGEKEIALKLDKSMGVTKFLTNYGDPFDLAKVLVTKFNLEEYLKREKERQGFYRDLPERLESLDDLKTLPFTTESDLAQKGGRMLLCSQGEIQRIISEQTSGTTGAGKRVFYTEGDCEHTIELFMAGLGEFIYPGSRTMVAMPFSGPSGLGELIADAIRRIGAHPLLTGNNKTYGELKTILEEERPDTYVGMPTALLSMLRMCGKGSIKRALISGDACPETVMKAIEKILGTPLWPHYGSREMGLGGAICCQAHEGMHMRENHCITEIIDKEGNVLPDGQWGELVITTIGMEAQPLIRYRTGDHTRIIPGKCICGSEVRRLDFVRRIDQSKSMREMDELLFQFPKLVDYCVRSVGGKKEITALFISDNGEELIRNVCTEKNIISLDCRKAEWSDRALYPAKRIIL